MHPYFIRLTQPERWDGTSFQWGWGSACLQFCLCELDLAFRKREGAGEVADMYPACFDRLAGRGLDGNTHAFLVSLADKLTSNHSGHQTLDASIDPFHAVFSIAKLGWGLGRT